MPLWLRQQAGLKETWWLSLGSVLVDLTSRSLCFQIAGWVFPFVGIVLTAHSSILGLALSSNRADHSLLPALTAKFSNGVLVGICGVSSVIILILGSCLAAACYRAQGISLQLRDNIADINLLQRSRMATKRYDDLWLASFAVYIVITIIFGGVCRLHTYVHR